MKVGHHQQHNTPTMGTTGYIATHHPYEHNSEDTPCDTTVREEQIEKVTVMLVVWINFEVKSALIGLVN